MNRKVLLTVFALLCFAIGFLYWFMESRDEREHSRVVYMDQCAGCHGGDLKGVGPVTSLMANPLRYGDSTKALMQSIGGELEAHKRLAGLDDSSRSTVKALALFISERRQKFPSIQASYQHAFVEQSVDSLHHGFRVEKYADLVSRPYSIAPLPDGNIIVSEKVRGLSVVRKDGKQGGLIEDAPPAYEPFLTVQGAQVGWGQLLEVALHPDFANNGWVYVSYSDRCRLDCGSVVPQSMTKVVRGRIKDGRWVDEQLIWSVHKDYYTVVPDAVAGGRLGFDKSGYLYVSVGGKATYKNLHNMDTPYGKIHRIRDDGSIPEDNPFWVSAEKRDATSTRHTVWSFGHRTIQGLEGHPLTGEIWSSEMGPRGGDEVNKIIGGGNYGWPLYTAGLDYDATEITIGKDLGLDFPIEDTVLPVVDFTPAPALSNLTFHSGDRFPAWKDDILIGSLKALTLYRLRIENGKLIEQEKLVTGLGRIRDVEMGADGLVYIAIEHGDGGSIVRLVPED